LDRSDPPAGPALWTRHLLTVKARRLLGHPRLQRRPVGQGARLVRRPSADAAFARAAGEIGVGLLSADRLDRAAHLHLATQALPVEQQGRGRIGPKLLALGAFLVGVEGEA